MVKEPQSPTGETNLSPISTSIEEIVVGMKSSDETIQLQATQACRKMLSREKNPPIDTMIQRGIVPHCIEFLDCHHKYIHHRQFILLLSKFTNYLLFS